MTWTVFSPYIINKVCSKECNNEFRWRETLSIMDKEYYPNPSKET